MVAATYTDWYIGLSLMLLLSLVVDIETSVERLLDTAGIVASHTVNIPKLALTPAVLILVIEEAIIKDGYMNSLTDGYTGAGLTNTPKASARSAGRLPPSSLSTCGGCRSGSRTSTARCRSSRACCRGSPPRPRSSCAKARAK